VLACRVSTRTITQKMFENVSNIWKEKRRRTNGKRQRERKRAEPCCAHGLLSCSSLIACSIPAASMCCMMTLLR
jgi:hypothetical protein